MKRALRLAVGFVTALVVGVGSLAVASTMTWPSINSHIAESAEAFPIEARRFPWFSVPMVLDDFSDAFKLNITYHDGPETSLRDALKGAYYSDDPSGPLVPAESLRIRVDGSLTANERYSSYWHGYMPIQRLIFSVMNVPEWRVLNSVLMALMLLVTLLMVRIRIGLDIAIGLAVTLTLVAPHLVPISLHYSPVFYLVLAGILSALLLGDRLPSRRYHLELFGLLGAATAYFDLLTAPSLALLIPLLILMAREVRRPPVSPDEPAGEGSVVSWALALLAIQACIAWAVSYVALWVTKWILNDILFNLGDLAAMFEHTAIRAGRGMSIADRWAAMLNNVYHVIPRPLWPDDATVLTATIVAGALAAGVATVWWVSARIRRIDREAVSRAWPILVVGLLPIAWLLFAAEHSFVHAFFTFRVLWSTLFSIWLWYCLTLRKYEVPHEIVD